MSEKIDKDNLIFSAQEELSSFNRFSAMTCRNIMSVIGEMRNAESERDKLKEENKILSETSYFTQYEAACKNLNEIISAHNALADENAELRRKLEELLVDIKSNADKAFSEETEFMRDILTQNIRVGLNKAIDMIRECGE